MKPGTLAAALIALGACLTGCTALARIEPPLTTRAPAVTAAASATQAATAAPTPATAATAPATATPQTAALISEYNDGLIRLGMTEDELLGALVQNGIEPSRDEYGGIHAAAGFEAYFSFDERGLLQYIATNGLPTTRALAGGAARADMIRIYGPDYIDIGEGPGEDGYAYEMDGYTFLIDFYDREQEVVTGWKITNMPDFEWALLVSLY